MLTKYPSRYKNGDLRKLIVIYFYKNIIKF